MTSSRPSPAQALKLPEQVHQCLFADAASAAEALAEQVASQLRSALDLRHEASLIVSGGRSPTVFLQRLSRKELNWAKVLVSLADERWIDPTNADSNEHLLRQNLLKNAAAAARLVPLKSAHREPEQAAEFVEADIFAMPRPFDVIVLGVGDDGHTASLIPSADETPQAMVSKRLLVATRPQTAPYPRLTMTLSAVLASRLICVLIAGESKRAAIERAVAQDPPLPIGAVLLNSRAPVQVYWSP